MSIEPTKYGATSPYLRLSREWGVSYEDVLVVADMLTHGRMSHGLPGAAERLSTECMMAVVEVASWFEKARNQPATAVSAGP